MDAFIADAIPEYGHPAARAGPMTVSYGAPGRST